MSDPQEGDVAAMMAEWEASPPAPAPTPSPPPPEPGPEPEPLDLTPTHALWRGDGSVEIVSLNGIDPESPDLTGLPEGFDWSTWRPDPDTRTFVPDIEGQRAKVWERAKAYKNAIEQTGSAMTPVGAVQCDDASKIKISGLVQMAMIAQAAGAPFLVEFTRSDNTNALIDTPEAMIGLGVAVGQHVAALHAAAQALRAVIEAAETLEDVAAIDIEGWAWP
jgi:hypothetical protein